MVEGENDLHKADVELEIFSVLSSSLSDGEDHLLVWKWEAKRSGKQCPRRNQPFKRLFARKQILKHFLRSSLQVQGQFYVYVCRFEICVSGFLCRDNIQISREY